MRGLRIFRTTLLVTLIAAAGCSKTVSDAGCSTNTDCPSDKHVCSDGLCVECLQSEDCAPGSYCEDQVCKVKPCTTHADCKDEQGQQYKLAPFCDPAQGRCVECMLRDNCTESESRPECSDGHCACVNNQCQTDPCSRCGASEVCYNGEQCVVAPADCTDNPNACASNEICVNVGDVGRCFIACDKNANLVDETGTKPNRNPVCWAGYGICGAVAWDSRTFCLPPTQQLNERGAACHDLTNISSGSFQDCKEGLRCAPLTDSGYTCAKACDGTRKPSSSSPECDGKACVQIAPEVDPKLGACDDRSRTRKELEGCEADDPNSPDFNRCQPGMKCKVINGVAKVCVHECGSSVGAGCNTGLECSDAVDGNCLPVHQATQESGAQCLQSDPTKPTWNDCVSWLVPCLDGVCGPVRTETRVIGEVCEQTDPAQADYNACEQGDTCYFKCLKTCSISAAVSGCAANEKCYDPANGTDNGLCVKECDPANGFATNSACAAGFTCYPASKRAYGTPGLCMPLPNPLKGTAQLGAACDNENGVFCDATAGLFCGPTRAGDTCFKACDPRQGTTGNADCGAGNECVDERYSPKGGKCAPTATKTDGQACDDASNRCVAGFFCTAENKCAKDCHFYLKTPATNDDCATGQYCTREAWVPFGGYCKALPAPETGTRKVGDRCSAGQCNGTQGLYCSNGYCEVACDPRLGVSGNAACASSQECSEDVLGSPKGGACLITPTQTVNQTCNPRTQRCLAGLACVKFTDALSLCKDACDPSVHVAQCPADNTCMAQETGAGNCVEEHLKTRIEGETCNVLTDPRQPDWNDCSGDLWCDEGGSNKCLSGLKRYEACGEQGGPECASIFICLGAQSVGNYYCLDTCTPGSTTCGTGFECLDVGNGAGACLYDCAGDADCTIYGTKCIGVDQQDPNHKVCI